MASAAGMAADSKDAVNRETYLKHLLTQASAAADESFLGLKALRQRAIALVGERAFPSRRDEEWRFTDLADMLTVPFERAKASTTTSLDDQINAYLTLFSSEAQLVTVDGHVASASTSLTNARGVVVAPLSQLLKNPDYAEQMQTIITDRLAQVPGGGEVFTALNSAGFNDVMVVWLPPDQVLDGPVHIVRGSQGGSMSHLRSLIIAERHANLTLVETFLGGDSQARCNNSVTEIWLGEGAHVNHIRVQDEAQTTFHIGKTAVDQAANSHYQCTAIDLGSKLSRHHLEVYQSGPQTDTHLYGLSAIGDRQLADTHSSLTLTYPHGSATQIQKNIVDDRAHSVFNGKVYVSQAAQLTDASQLNRNLMLSNKARVDTKPELDIVADNVKCAHGATVSQLQADEIFYLQSRGISASQAQRLLLYGFAMEIVEKISVDALKRSLSERLTEWAN